MLTLLPSVIHFTHWSVFCHCTSENCLYYILVMWLHLFSQLLKFYRCLWNPVQSTTCFCLTVFTALFRLLSVPYSIPLQTQIICYRIVYIISVLCVLMYAYLYVCAVGPGTSAEDLLQSCCAAGQKWATENHHCNHMSLFNSDKHSICRWVGPKCHIVIIV